MFGDIDLDTILGNDPFDNTDLFKKTPEKTGEGESFSLLPVEDPDILLVKTEQNNEKVVQNKYLIAKSLDE